MNPPARRKPWSATDYLLTAGAAVPLLLFLWWRLDTREPGTLILVVQHTLDYALAASVLPCAALLARGRSRCSLSLTAAVLVSFLSLGARGGPSPAPSVRGGTDLRILSWNLMFINRRHDVLLGYVKKTDPDVLVLLEWSQDHEETLAGRLRRTYPYVHSVPSPLAYGIAVFSKTPLRFLAGSEDSVNETSWEVVALGDGNSGAGDTCLAAVHLVSSIPPLILDQGYFRHSDRVRRHEIERIRQATAGCRHSVWAGDFNDTPNSELYRMVRNSMVDVFGELQRFPEKTFKWRSWMRLFPIRIDYVFTDPGIEIRSGQVLEGEGSDHRALLAALRIPTSRAVPAVPER